MNFQDIVVATKFKISNSVKYTWKCYGENANHLDFNSNFKNVNASCVFDTKSQIVYEVSLYVGEKAYRWLNPEFKNEMYSESFSQKCDPREWFDEMFYYDCEIFEDLIEKITDCYNTGTCTNDIMVQLELDSEQISVLTDLSKEIGLDRLVNQILTKKMEDIETENKLNWSILINNLKIKEINITINSLKAPLSFENISNVEKEIEKSGLKILNLTYSNKLTQEGLIHSLDSKSFNYDYSIH